MPFTGLSAYVMTKAALQGMARGLSRDVGPRAITVNVVQPGPTDTDMNPARARGRLPCSGRCPSSVTAPLTKWRA